MLTQRLRWAQGTVQVMLRENPLVQRGLSLAERLMYWATMSQLPVEDRPAGTCASPLRRVLRPRPDVASAFPGD